jgi:tRNA G10  N-methylase Trm11
MFHCRWFCRHFQDPLGGNPSVLVTNAGTGTELMGAVLSGLNCIGVDSSRTMIHTAKKRLQSLVEAQENRLQLARKARENPDLVQLISAAVVQLPVTTLASPDKRRITALARDNLSSQLQLYHALVNCPWTKRKPRKGVAYILRAGLKLHIM